MENKQAKCLNPTELFNPVPYGFSHSVFVQSPFKICFVSGQSGGQGTDHILSEDFREQVQNALENLGIVLGYHDMTLDNIVKISLLIVDHDPKKLEIWSHEAGRVWNPTSLPTSTLIPVSKLALPGMLFEIDAIAIKTDET